MIRRLAPILRAVLVGGLLLGLGGVAEAHRLKVFATVEDGEISGYAFFVGGGRPEGVAFLVKDANGREVHRAVTDDTGRFRWRPPSRADYTVLIDTGDGHWAEAKIAADRLAEAGPAPVATADAAPTSPPPAAATTPPAGSAPAPVDPAALSREVERAVDVAVARQIRPLLEAYDQAEGRIRLNDVMGGVGMIVGLAGAMLWASARRREKKDTGR